MVQNLKASHLGAFVIKVASISFYLCMLQSMNCHQSCFVRAADVPSVDRGPYEEEDEFVHCFDRQRRPITVRRQDQGLLCI